MTEKKEDTAPPVGWLVDWAAFSNLIAWRAAGTNRSVNAALFPAAGSTGYKIVLSDESKQRQVIEDGTTSENNLANAVAASIKLAIARWERGDFDPFPTPTT